MIINKPGAVFLYDGIEYRIGEEIIGTNESEYEGLLGSITEIRTDDDKDTENEGPDFYCSFNPPVWPTDISRLEDVFSDLYGEPKKLEDITLDIVIMASSMVRPFKRAAHDLTVVTLEMDWAANDEQGHEVYVFSSETIARTYLNKLLEDEMNEGCIPDWRDDEDFREDTDGLSYECWLEGFYNSHHFSLSIKPKVLPLDDVAFGTVGRAYIDSSRREDFAEQIEPWEELGKLTHERYEKMKADPTLPERIHNALSKNDAYWEAYWQSVSEVAHALVLEYLKKQAQEGAE